MGSTELRCKACGAKGEPGTVLCPECEVGYEEVPISSRLGADVMVALITQDRRQPDLGGLIKRLLLMSPFNKLSEDDKMIAAGLLGGAMNEAIRLSQAPYSAADVLNSPDAYAAGWCGSVSPEPVSLSDILYAQARPCFACGQMIDEATLMDGQIVTLDRDRVRHKLRCKERTPPPVSNT